MKWLGAIGEAAAVVAPGRVRLHPWCARTRGGPTAAPLWPIAPNGYVDDVAVGASIRFKILLPNLIFPQNFYYVLNFHKYIFF